MSDFIDARDRALELVQDGFVSTEDMLTMCLKFMSNDDVAEMLELNELSESFMDDPNYPYETEEVEE